MSLRDPKRSLSVPLRLIGDDVLGWSKTVPASDLLPAGESGPLRIADIEVPLSGDVHVEVSLERISGGLTVTGQIDAAWNGPCARCWACVEGRATASVNEVFTTTPTEGEQYGLDAEAVNLVPMVREAILLELPIEAVPCPNDEPCPNLPDELTTMASTPSQSHLDPPAEPQAEPTDPRWAALDVLRDRT